MARPSRFQNWEGEVSERLEKNETLPAPNQRRHWKRIRATNGLERLHGEIKRRTKAVGAFPDRASALRLITAVALKVTTRWSDRRYVDVALLENQEVEPAA